ncbi:hypothetical protein WICMUC_003940 [Wickerhamomyces mucosus]|uniref:Uncharacterized protein n=1 Tax=Wickerhamomyces mucosus TaxID=1378264 RepID=A0A9P8PJL6_9ASCO|nr:hypothetical protein WICMUC_003940 [Wickerhamomyces mucosus]
MSDITDTSIDFKINSTNEQQDLNSNNQPNLIENDNSNNNNQPNLIENDNNNNNNPNLIENDNNHNQPKKKKKSFANYLANVDKRKKELKEIEKIEKKMAKKEEERLNKLNEFKEEERFKELNKFDKLQIEQREKELEILQELNKREELRQKDLNNVKKLQDNNLNNNEKILQDNNSNNEKILQDNNLNNNEKILQDNNSNNEKILQDNNLNNNEKKPQDNNLNNNEKKPQDDNNSNNEKILPNDKSIKKFIEQPTSPLSTLPSEITIPPSSLERKIQIERSIPKIPSCILEIDDLNNKKEYKDQNIDSDVETVYDYDDHNTNGNINSPIKLKRGRGKLIRKSELEGNKLMKKVGFDRDEILEIEQHLQKIKHHDDQIVKNSRSSSPKQQLKKSRVGRDSAGRLKLQRFCDKGKLEEAKILIKEGANVNDQDYAGNSALHEAALKGFTDIVKLLLDNGAEVDLMSGPDDLDTPLIDAAANGHVDTVKLLLKYGADPRIQNAHGENALDSLNDDDENLLELQNLLKKSLMELKKKMDNKLPNHEIHSDYDELSEGDYNNNFNKPKRSNYRSRNDLLLVDFTTRNGRDEVFSRASEGDVQFVGTYLENGGKPYSEALALASKFGHTDVANLLIAFGAKIDGPTVKGLTALMQTVGRNHLDTVKLLLEAGADPNKLSKDGKTALDYAKDSLIVDEDEILLLKNSMERNNSGEIFDKQDKKRKNSIKDELEIEEHELKKSKSDNKSENVKIIQKEIKSDPPKTNSNQIHDETKKVKIQQKSVTSSPVSSQQQIISSTTMIVPHVETEEEKHTRLLKEKEEQQLREQYEAERVAKRKAREQEFLNNIVTQEKRKQEELEKLSLLEEQKKIQNEKQIEEKLFEEKERKTLMSKKEELDRRSKIRESYPYGLLITTFNNDRTKEEILKYLPLYIHEIDGVSYVIDLQVIMVLGIELFYKKYPYASKTPINFENKSKIFNYIYPILGNFNNRSTSKQLEDYKIEFVKFKKLSTFWLKYDDLLKILEKDFPHLIGIIKARSLKIDLEGINTLESSNFTTNNIVSRKVSSTYPINSIKKNIPWNLRGRPSVLKVLSKNKRLW